jgi:hypothetical protein
MVLSGIPILPQIPLIFQYYRETKIKDYEDNFEQKKAAFYVVAFVKFLV